MPHRFCTPKRQFRTCRIISCAQTGPPSRRRPACGHQNHEKPGPCGPGFRCPADRADGSVRRSAPMRARIRPMLSRSACSRALSSARSRAWSRSSSSSTFLSSSKASRQQALGVFKLNAQFVGGAGQVFPPLDRRLGIGRIGEVRGIVDPGALLLGVDFALQVDRHALEIGDHAFDLGDPSALFIDLKLLQADQRFT